MLLSAGRVKAVVLYALTNDLSAPYNVTYYSQTTNYTYATNLLVAAGGNVTINQGGSFVGVAFQATNGGVMMGAPFTLITSTGGNLSMIRSNSSVQFTATNDLGAQVNLTYFLLTNGLFAFGTNQTVATNNQVALVQAGVNWSGVSLQSTNGGLITAAYFTNIGTTGCRLSYYLSNDLYASPALFSGTPGTIATSGAFSNVSPGTISAPGTWTNSSH